MSTITEQDLDLLDAWLDDELSPAEAARLGRRLDDQPELAAALDELKNQRRLCSAAFESLEPDDAQVQQLVGRINSAVRRHNTYSFILRATRYVSAAAACLAIAFFAGMVVQNRLHHTPVTPGHGATPVTQVFEVTLADAEGNVVAVQKFDTREEAEAFSAALTRYQEKQRAARAANATLLSDRF